MNPTNNASTLQRFNASTLQRFLKSVSLYFSTIGGCVLFVLFSVRIAPPVQAQSTPTPTPTCTATPTPTPVQSCTVHSNDPCQSTPCLAPSYPPDTPHAVPIPTPFQPHDAAGNLLPTVLEWRIFPPTPEPTSHKGPIVLLLHEGEFDSGNIFSRLLTDPETDLTAEGFYVFVPAWPLAPCGLIKGQACHANDPSSGRPPQQTDAIKAFIRAARADSHYDGWIAIVGGSAGGSHAAFVTFDISQTSVWPFWNSGGHDDRPDVAVCLSGSYDFAARTTENYPAVPGNPVDKFNDIIENYTGTCVRYDPNHGPDQWSVSPVGILQPFTTQFPFKPMYFINSQYDSMPFHQIIDVQCALSAAGVSSTSYQVLTIPNSREHAFAYWRSWDGQPGSILTIVGRVVSFLNAHR